MLCVAPVPLNATPRRPAPFVLIVDDHEPSVRGLCTVLESVGYTCEARCCPAAALEFSQAHPPSLVVTDLAMPRLDGHGLARGLKARYPGLPIVLVTGERLDAATFHAFQHTFEGVFSKPLEIDPFLRVLRRLLPPSGPRGATRA